MDRRTDGQTESDKLVEEHNLGGVVDSKVRKEEGGERDDRRDDGGLLAWVLGERGWDGVMSG